MIAQVSDEKINFWRDMHFKRFDAETGKAKKLEVEEGIHYPITKPMYLWKDVLVERKLALGLTCMSEDGTMYCTDFVVQAFKLHNDSVREANTLWTEGGEQTFVFSGDALQTAKGEKHNLCALRSGLLKNGFSSALNFYPLSNAIGGDSWFELMLQLKDHRVICNQIVFDRKLASKDGLQHLSCDIFSTGDLAFILHFFGMNTASSTHGNPWVIRVEVVDEQSGTKGIVVKWRETVNYYLHSHVLPPKECDWWKDVEWPWVCDCCGEAFESPDSFKTKEAELRKMGDQARRAWQTLHYGQVPLQEPLFYVEPAKMLAPMFHTMENLIDHRWKHLIWSRAKTNQQQYDVNSIIKERCGTAHLPPRRGDKGTMCKAFIGGELCKMRADGKILADVIDVVVPKLVQTPQAVTFQESASNLPIQPNPQPSASGEYLDELDDLYLNEDSDEDGPPDLTQDQVEEQLQSILNTAERVSLSNMPLWDMVANSFDLAWDFIDMLMDEEWDDSTEDLRKERAEKLRQLAKGCNEAEQRATLGGNPVFSEYQMPW